MGVPNTGEALVAVLLRDLFLGKKRLCGPLVRDESQRNSIRAWLLGNQFVRAEGASKITKPMRNTESTNTGAHAATRGTHRRNSLLNAWRRLLVEDVRRRGLPGLSRIWSVMTGTEEPENRKESHVRTAAIFEDDRLRRRLYFRVHGAVFRTIVIDLHLFSFARFRFVVLRKRCTV